MVLKKGLSTKEWRQALAIAEDAQQIFLKTNQEINEEECEWDVFTEEILPRLPTNQLQTLKSACKNSSQIRVVIPDNYGGTLTEYKIGSDEETEMKIRYPPAIRTRESTILGSWDGLLCLLLRAEIGTRQNHSIAVYNPSSAKYFLLQSPLKYDYKISCSWFGHHPCSGEYILVSGNLDDEIGVYKFNNRRSNLKKIHSTSCCANTLCFHENRVGTGLLHGAMHWHVQCRDDCSHKICAYHLDDNKYFEFSPPLQRGFKLGCLFVSMLEQLWMMKEYKDKQSWTKCANIRGEGFYNSRIFSPLGFFPNGNLILYPNKLGLINYTFNETRLCFFTTPVSLNLKQLCVVIVWCLQELSEHESSNITCL